MKKVFTFIKSIFIGLIVWFLIHSIYITIDGLNDKKTNADVAIVLGNKVNEDGTLSERLKARLDKSLELYNQNRVKIIIVSGGLGKEGFWEGKKNYSERKVLRISKVQARIILNRGISTPFFASLWLIIKKRFN